MTRTEFKTKLESYFLEAKVDYEMTNKLDLEDMMDYIEEHMFPKNRVVLQPLGIEDNGWDNETN